ncbi:hypothetical protein ETD86_43625 [Nonomuraea turkmeniaca]|uniref:Uncharacterized protein n=1 Tax=Nonomuraea turkmeniaca TaxID=103838 RepID=A0A5S4FK15_9ACTN|nr:hypothetical protein [Nonomuraea turkmeniaca]TMR09433.1 hypothetical protein ETD86_43625 [Nonomuraea turkmeniaca]
MSFFKRDGARREPVRRSVEDVDLDSLLALVAESRGYTCAFARDGATVTLTGDMTLVVRLRGLRREAGRRAREDWPVLVSEHLAHAVATAGEQVDVCDLEQAGPLLRTRVEPVDELADLTRVVGRHLSADLVELLTVGSRPIRPEEAGCWPVPTAHALDLAVANVRRDERLFVEGIELSGTPVSRLTARTPSAATHLRWLGDYLQVPADGVLAVLPDPYTLLVHPVDGIGVVRAIERLRVHALCTDGLSQQVYWWHESRLTLIKADIVVQRGQTRLVVAPPPEFAQVLARLAV